MEHEKVRIPPFNRIKVASNGSLGYVMGNVPYIAYSEGKDDLKLLSGSVLPVSSQFVELWNPFSYAAEMQILRGAPVCTNYILDGGDDCDLAISRAGVLIKSQANGGDSSTRRRAIGLIPRRGKYRVSLVQAGGSADDQEIITIPHANPMFLASLPAGVLSSPLNFYRNDGTENLQMIGVSGSYTQAEIDAWKASVGYTFAERKMWTNASSNVVIDPGNAVLFTNTGAAQIRFQAIVTELGDMESGLREV